MAESGVWPVLGTKLISIVTKITIIIIIHIKWLTKIILFHFCCTICTSYAAERSYWALDQVHGSVLGLDASCVNHFAQNCLPLLFLLQKIFAQIIKMDYLDPTFSHAPWFGIVQNGTVPPLQTPIPATWPSYYPCCGLLQPCNEQFLCRVFTKSKSREYLHDCRCQ